MALYIYETDDDLFKRAVHFVVKAQHGGISTLQRKFGISFKEADELIRRMRTRGIVGYTTGSKAAPVLVKCCEQCGRMGRRSFVKVEMTEHTDEMWFCEVKTACRKRWPKERREDED